MIVFVNHDAPPPPQLARRVDQSQVFGLTAPLITTSSGRKMGKTEGGAVWLNKDRLSPYEYWQFWRNTDDDDVGRFLRLFTEVELEEIEELEKRTGAEINDVKKVLADETTALLHGRDCLPEIWETAASLFKPGGSGGAAAGAGDTSGLARVSISRSDLGTAQVADMLLRLGLATSKKDARRLIAGGGAKIKEEKVEDERRVMEEGDFVDGECVLRAGKKRAGVVVLS